MPGTDSRPPRPSPSTAHRAHANPVDSSRTGCAPRSDRCNSLSIEHDSSRRRGSKSSLFTLFSRSKVDGQRANNQSATGVSDRMDRAPPRLYGPQSTRSSKTGQSSLPSLTSHSITVIGSPRVSSDSLASRHESLRSKHYKGPGQMPPLFQAYAQAEMASKAQIADGAIQTPSASRRGSSSDIVFRAEKPRRSASITSNRYSALPRKIFTLTRSGRLLQYSDEGMSDRIPERVLHLSGRSTAGKCNFIPGENFVILVTRDAQSMEAAQSSSASLLSRIGLRRPPSCTEAHCMVMVLQNEKEVCDWITALNRTISSLGIRGIQSSSEHEQPDHGSGELQNKRLDSAIDGQKESAMAVHHISSVTSTMDGFVLPPPHQLETLNDISEESLGLRPVTRSSLHGCFKTNKCATKEQATPARRPSRSGRESIKDYPQDTSRGGRGPTYEEEIRSRLPFKLRSAIIPDYPLSSSAFTSAPPPTLASPMQSPQHDTFPADDDASRVDSSQTKSTVAELPNFWNAHTNCCATTAPLPPVSQGEALRPGSKIQFHTAEPSRPRQPHMLRIDTSVLSNGPIVTRESQSPISPLSPISPNIVTDTTKAQTPQSSSFSLFPTPKIASSPLVTPTRPQTPIKDMRSRAPASKTVHHRVLRSASTTSKPKKSFERVPVSPLSPAHQGTWKSPLSPPLNQGLTNSCKDLKAQSAIHPMLRSSSPNPNQRLFPPRTSSRSTTPDFTTSSSPSPHSTRQMPRSISAQGSHPSSSRHGFPKPTRQRPGTGNSASKRGSGSGVPGLPELDLGIPVIGLAPPVPPPDRNLPRLPAPKVDVEARVKVSVRGRVKEGRGRVNEGKGQVSKIKR